MRADAGERLDQQLAAIEARVVALRRMVAANRPCDDVLDGIGITHAMLDQAAATVAGLSGAQGAVRLTPDQLRAEFEHVFRLQLERLPHRRKERAAAAGAARQRTAHSSLEA